MMKVVTGHKGMGGFKVHIRGHEVHSSLLPYGVSATMEAGRLIQWANEVNAESAATTPNEINALFEPPWSNLHVGMIEGGTAHNITAKDCEFVFSVRVAPGDQPEDWQARIMTKVAEIEAGMKSIHPDARIEVIERFAGPGLFTEPGGTAETLVRQLTGDNARHVVSYGTEAGYFQKHGFDAVVCGPGDIEQAHQPDEFIEVAQFEAGHAFMRRLLDRLNQD